MKQIILLLSGPFVLLTKSICYENKALKVSGTGPLILLLLVIVGVSGCREKPKENLKLWDVYPDSGSFIFRKIDSSSQNLNAIDSTCKTYELLNDTVYEVSPDFTFKTICKDKNIIKRITMMKILNELKTKREAKQNSNTLPL